MKKLRGGENGLFLGSEFFAGSFVKAHFCACGFAGGSLRVILVPADFGSIRFCEGAYFWVYE